MEHLSKSELVAEIGKHNVQNAEASTRDCADPEAISGKADASWALEPPEAPNHEPRPKGRSHTRER